MDTCPCCGTIEPGWNWTICPSCRAVLPKHYRLFNGLKGVLVGQFNTLEEARKVTRQVKGMILWCQFETRSGWVWTQEPITESVTSK